MTVNVDDVRLEVIGAANWREALGVRVRDDQLPFVADHQPVALVILAKAHVQPGGRWWEPMLVRSADGTVVGVFAIEHGDDACELRNFAVHHEVQGRGTGTAAARAAIERARRADTHCQELAVSAHADNHAAHRAYQAAGFEWDGGYRDDEPLMRIRTGPTAE